MRSTPVVCPRGLPPGPPLWSSTRVLPWVSPWGLPRCPLDPPTWSLPLSLSPGSTAEVHPQGPAPVSAPGSTLEVRPCSLPLGSSPRVCPQGRNWGPPHLGFVPGNSPQGLLPESSLGSSPGVRQWDRAPGSTPWVHPQGPSPGGSPPGIHPRGPPSGSTLPLPPPRSATRVHHQGPPLGSATRSNPGVCPQVCP